MFVIVVAREDMKKEKEEERGMYDNNNLQN